MTSGPSSLYKIVIMCAGKGQRWKGSTPKQLAKVKGQPNLLRTISLLEELGVSKDDIVVTVNKDNASFFPQELSLFIGSAEREIDRYRNSFSFIQDCQKVIYLYGDVVYDRKDLVTILTQEKDAFLGRQKGNKLTRKSWGEIFAVVVHDIQKFMYCVNDIAYKFEKRLIQRELGWEVYLNHKNKYQFIELSLYTDDYDTEQEYQIMFGLKFI